MIDLWYATFGSYTGAIATDDDLIKIVARAVNPDVDIISPQRPDTR